MKKRFLSILLTLCMLLTALPVTPIAFAADNGTATLCAESGCSGTYENGFCTADGTHYQAAEKNADDYYEIGNAGQLYWFAAKVNGGEWSLNGKLTADITVNENLVKSFTFYKGYIDSEPTSTLRTWSTSGGTVKVENTGNVTVTASFTYASETAGNGISGAFDQAHFNLNAGESGTSTLLLTGKPSTNLNNSTIGTITITITQAKEGWQSENGDTSYYVNGEKTTQWLKIDGEWYYFNADGAMQTGWCTDIPGYEEQWFYFDPTTGVMKTGWVQDGGSRWFYFDTNGMIQTGWKQINGYWYYFHEDGHMATGETIDGCWINADGRYEEG